MTPLQLLWMELSEMIPTHHSNDCRKQQWHTRESDFCVTPLRLKQYSLFQFLNFILTYHHIHTAFPAPDHGTYYRRGTALRSRALNSKQFLNIIGSASLLCLLIYWMMSVEVEFTRSSVKTITNGATVGRSFLINLMADIMKVGKVVTKATMY